MWCLQMETRKVCSVKSFKTDQQNLHRKFDNYLGNITGKDNRAKRNKIEQSAASHHAEKTARQTTGAGLRQQGPMIMMMIIGQSADSLQTMRVALWEC